MRQYRSRLAAVEEQKSIRSAVMFGGLTIVIIILAIFFGIQIFSRFTSFFIKKTDNTATQNATLPTPNLSTLPQNTKDQTIVVKGNSKPNSNVRIYFNSGSDVTVTDGDGNFAMNVNLSKGSNTIYAVTEDDKGSSSLPSTKYTVNFTNQIPNLTINTPQNNQTFYTDSQKTISIQGSTDINNSVTVNDRVAVVDSTGKFNLNYDLQNGDNNLKVVSQDSAGNKKEIDLKVTFNP